MYAVVSDYGPWRRVAGPQGPSRRAILSHLRRGVDDPQLHYCGPRARTSAIFAYQFTKLHRTYGCCVRLSWQRWLVAAACAAAGWEGGGCVTACGCSFNRRCPAVPARRQMNWSGVRRRCRRKNIATSCECGRSLAAALRVGSDTDRRIT